MSPLFYNIKGGINCKVLSIMLLVIAQKKNSTYNFPVHPPPPSSQLDRKLCVGVGGGVGSHFLLNFLKAIIFCCDFGEVWRAQISRRLFTLTV